MHETPFWQSSTFWQAAGVVATLLGIAVTYFVSRRPYSEKHDPVVRLEQPPAPAEFAQAEFAVSFRRPLSGLAQVAIKNVGSGSAYNLELKLADKSPAEFHFGIDGNLTTVEPGELVVLFATLVSPSLYGPIDLDLLWKDKTGRRQFKTITLTKSRM